MASISEKRELSPPNQSSVQRTLNPDLPPTTKTTQEVFNATNLSSAPRRSPSPPITGSLVTSGLNKTWNYYAWDPTGDTPS